MPDLLQKAQTGRDGGWALHRKGCVSILVVARLIDQVLRQLYCYLRGKHRGESGLKQQLHDGCGGLSEEEPEPDRNCEASVMAVGRIPG